MKKTRATEAELTAIKKAMEQAKKVRVYRRYQALYLYLSGKTGKEVADISGLTTVTVSNIHRTYMTGGLQAIQDKMIPGRPSRLNEQQQQQLLLAVRARPQATVQDAAAYVEKNYHVRYTERGMKKLLERLGIIQKK